MLIIKMSNYINTALGMVTICKWPSGAQVEKVLSLLQNKVIVCQAGHFIDLY